MTREELLSRVRSSNPGYYASYSDDQLADNLLKTSLGRQYRNVLGKSSTPLEPVQENRTPEQKESDAVNKYTITGIVQPNQPGFNPQGTFNSDPEYAVGPKHGFVSDQSIDEDFTYMAHVFKSLGISTAAGMDAMLLTNYAKKLQESLDSNPRVPKYNYNAAIPSAEEMPNYYYDLQEKHFYNVKTNEVYKHPWEKEVPIANWTDPSTGEVKQITLPSPKRVVTPEYKRQQSGVKNLIELSETRRKLTHDKIKSWEENNPKLEAYLEWQKQNPMSVEKIFSDIDYIHRGVATLIPSIAASTIATATMGPAGGAAVMFSMESAAQYNEAMEYLINEKGLEPAQASEVARNTAMIYGGISSAIEYWQLDNMLKFTGLKKTGGKLMSNKIMDVILRHTDGGKKGILKKIASGAGSFVIQDLEQATQEGLQQVAQLMVQNAYKKYGADTGSMNYDEAVKNLWADFKEAAQSPEAVESFLTSAAGFIPGGVVSAGVKVTGVGEGAVEDTYDFLRADIANIIDKGQKSDLSSEGTTPSIPTQETKDPDKMSDEEAIIRSMMPLTEDDDYNLALDDRAQKAKDKLNISDMKGEAEFIKTEVMKDGSSVLDQFGIDQAEFIDNYNDNFGEDISSIFEAADQVIDGDAAADQTQPLDPWDDESWFDDDKPFDESAELDQIDETINKFNNLDKKDEDTPDPDGSSPIELDKNVGQPSQLEKNDAQVLDNPVPQEETPLDESDLLDESQAINLGSLKVDQGPSQEAPADKVHPAILEARQKQHDEWMAKAKKRSLADLRDVAKANNIPGHKKMSKKDILAKLEAKAPERLTDEVLKTKEGDANLAKIIAESEAAQAEEALLDEDEATPIGSINPDGTITPTGQQAPEGPAPVQTKPTELVIDSKQKRKEGSIKGKITRFSKPLEYDDSKSPDENFKADQARLKKLQNAENELKESRKAYKDKLKAEKKPTEQKPVEKAEEETSKEPEGPKTLGDILDERLQVVNEQESIKENRKTADLIIERLGKTFKNIQGEELAKVFDKHGNEVAGKALGLAAQWSEDKAGLDTPPHEYSHIYLDILYANKNKEVVSAIESIMESENLSLDDAMEQMAQYIGVDYVDRATRNSIPKKIQRFARRFWLLAKKQFKGLNTKEYQELIADRFFQGKNANQITADAFLSKTERLQNIKEGSLSELQGFNLFNQLWNNAQAKARKNIVMQKPGRIELNEFNRQVFNSVPKEYHDLYRRWVAQRFEGDKYMKFLKTAGEGEGVSFLDEEDSFDIIKDELHEVNEGLDLMPLENNSIDARGVGKIAARTFNSMGVILNQDQTAKLYNLAAKAGTFDNFVKMLVDQKRNLEEEHRIVFTESAVKKNTRQLKQWWLSQKNKLRVNQDKGIGNERLNLVMNKTLGIVSPKGPKHVLTNKTNPDSDRKMLAEWDLKRDSNGNDLVPLAWLSGNDLIEQRGAKRVESYNFLTEEDLYKLSANLKNVGKNGMVPVFNRGDSAKMGFVMLTDRHAFLGKHAKKYWTGILANERTKLEKKLSGKELEKALRSRSNMLNNFLGLNLTKEDKEKLGIKTQADMEFFKAQEIARFEAIEAYMPGMMFKGDGAKIMKRIKVPFTPVIRSTEMPDANIKVFDFNKVSFRFKGKINPATIMIDGKPKYIGDGGTLTSRTFFNNMAFSFGMKEGINHAKTVMYENSSNGFGIFKHQHYAPPIGLEILEDGKMIAKVDANGDIVTKDGEKLDMMLTSDEAKALDGGFEDAVNQGKSFKLKGTSIGLIKYAEGNKTTSKHPMQWYNYIRDPQIKRLFKQDMLPKVTNKIKEAWEMVVDTELTSEQKVQAFLEKLEGEYPEGLAHSLVEKTKLDAGMHPDIEGMLNVIVQTAILEKGIQLSNNPGTMSDIAPNLTGDLEKGEVSLSYEQADFVIDKYMKETGNPEPTRFELNSWLETRNLEVFVSRSPIPYAGGATMMRVKNVDAYGGLVEMHPEEVYVRFEGDQDGDKVAIELLTDEMTDIYKSVTKDIPVTPVQLSKYVTQKDKIDVSDRREYYKLSDALAFGTKAIGEIANVQSTYGTLQEIVESIVVDGELITIRPPKEVLPGTDINLDDYYRLLLQASVDNAEHLALKDLGYSLEKIKRMMFKVDRGEGKKSAISDRQWNVIKAIINEHKMPNRFRRGRNANFEKHRFDTSINESYSYLEYVRDRFGTIQSKVNFERHKLEQMQKSDEMGTVGKDWLRFKSGMHVAEEIAILPARLDEFYRSGNAKDKDHITNKTAKVLANRETPYRIDYKGQLANHTTSINNIGNKARQMIMAFRNFYIDKPGGLAQFKEDVKKGVTYAREMGGEYFQKIISENQSLGPQAWEKNDQLLKFVSKWGQMFQTLPQASQVAATFAFLEGFDKISKESGLNQFEENNLSVGEKKNTSSLPPYGESKGMYSLLDPKVMQMYNQEYNQLMRNEKPSGDVRINARFTDVVETICKI